MSSGLDKRSSEESKPKSFSRLRMIRAFKQRAVSSLSSQGEPADSYDKESIKSVYTENIVRAAVLIQSFFRKQIIVLRQKKRELLVAYLLNIRNRAARII
jgi:hypothetical protein